MDSLDLDVVNWERTRLRLFQFFLHDLASNWLERLPAGSISTWEDLTTRFLAQFLSPERTAKLRNDILIGKLRDKNTKESWEIIQNLALYDHEGWNYARDFAKPQNKNSSFPKRVHFINTITIIRKEDEPREAGIIEPHATKNNDHNTIVEVGDEVGEELSGLKIVIEEGESRDIKHDKQGDRACREAKEVGEWMEYKESLDLVNTNEESVYESLIEKMYNTRYLIIHTIKARNLRERKSGWSLPERETKEKILD
uniref:MAK10-like protein n=1 Tax=Tanacetum cinerariifolium TaxID=118510 RepID=A0A6L2JQS0_TANCI|nr:MAK10-like protein [Tanacetum cinerariifolium]